MSADQKETIALLAATKAAVGMTEEQLAYLASVVVLKSASDAEPILEESDPGYYLVVLLTGKAQVLGAFGQEINVAEEGALLGELSFLDKMSRSATVMAAGDCRYAMISEQAIDEMRKARPDIAFILIWNVGLGIAHKLRSATRLVNALSASL